MCGIVGIAGRKDEGLINSMCGCIRHRGPDEEGTVIEQDVSLGIQRLSIIDLEGGSQPIENEDGSVIVIFNGEIYNYHLLRDQLESRGHRFTTHVDTEVLVHGYEEWGHEFVSRLNGMFAFAIWDREQDRLILARDRLGIKPLYYASLDDALVFSSELTALLEHPRINSAIDETALKQYWTFRYVPAPWSILRNVRKLEPATVAMVSLNDLNLTFQRYWFPCSSETRSNPRSFRDLLETAVSDRLMADVPLGVFLSGGLDSTSVVALMNEVSSEPINTFSIGFANNAYDETSFSKKVASEFGTNHHELTVDPESMQIFDEVVASMDEPLGDPAMIPTYLLAERAAQDVKVVLTGEGSDELFAGYEKYRRYTNWWDTVGGYPTPLYRIASVAETVVPKWSKVDRYLKYLASHNKQETAFETIMMPQYDAFDFSGKRIRDAIRVPIDNAFMPSEDYPRNLLCFDQRYSLPDNLLTKVDRMTMAHSLEARVPFLDHQVVESANSINPRTHLGEGTKPVLRDAVSDIVPKYVRRRDKHGFHMPIKEWFARPLDTIADSLSPHIITDVPHLDFSKVNSMLESHQAGDNNYAHYLWRILVYIRWYRRHIADYPA
jgi:asparagine synthase (glutamine-hydrolysing)